MTFADHWRGEGEDRMWSRSKEEEKSQAEVHSAAHLPLIVTQEAKMASIIMHHFQLTCTAMVYMACS